MQTPQTPIINKLKQAISEALELPKEVTMNLPLISILGSEEIVIENYKGIIEYTEERIRVNTTTGVLKLEGRKMCLKQITAENIKVTGVILKLEYLH